MTSNLYSIIVSQIATDSLSALVKETELLQNPSNGNCKHLPSQDHFDQRYALRSRSVNPQQKDQAEELFPSKIEVGFQMKCSFIVIFCLFIHRSVAQSNLPHLFVRQLRPELIRYLPAFVYIYRLMLFYYLDSIAKIQLSSLSSKSFLFAGGDFSHPTILNSSYSSPNSVSIILSVSCSYLWVTLAR